MRGGKKGEKLDAKQITATTSLLSILSQSQLGESNMRRIVVMEWNSEWVEKALKNCEASWKTES